MSTAQLKQYNKTVHAEKRWKWKMLLINCAHSRQETKERIKTEYDQTILITADDKTVLIKLTTTSCVCLFLLLSLLTSLSKSPEKA